jgi:hypothetical protein
MAHPASIAAQLYAASFATPAAILVALIDDPSMPVLTADRHHIGTLRERGCLGPLCSRSFSLRERQE